jgi:TctA family transporter
MGIFALITLAPLMTKLALSFGSAEYFAIMVLGLVAAVTISQGSPLKGLAMVILGLLLGSVGTDVDSGILRFSFGFSSLFDGINLVALAMGLFGISEIVASIGSRKGAEPLRGVSLRSMMPTPDDTRQSAMPILRGSLIGSILGPLPGTGPTIASFLSYAVEKRSSRTPERFGKGAIEGIAGPESSNNAAAITAFIPTLTLGVPGSATMAFMLGALLIHGIVPGPTLITQHPDIFWGLIASFFIGNFVLLILNIPLIGIWLKILEIPYYYLFPTIVSLVCIGVYSVNNNVFDIWMVLVFGAFGYGMTLLDFEPAPLIVGFILGPLMEENLRRSLVLTGGDFMGLLYRPISGTILVLTMLLMIWVLARFVMSRLRAREAPVAT